MTPAADLRTSSGVRGRTRRAILDAAASLWARDLSISLGDIADHAEVSRSTLHRYFPERRDLLQALIDDSQQAMIAAAEQAGFGSKPPVNALENLIRGLVDLGDRLIFLFSDLHRAEGDLDWGDDDDAGLIELIRQAQADGAVGADLDPAWVQSALFALAYVGTMSVTDGTLPRHVAADMTVRTFLHGVSAQPSR